MAEESRTPLSLYLAGITTLAAFSVFLLVVLFTAGFADLVEAFLANPPATVRENPLVVAVFLGVLVSILALVTVVVVVGAQYAIEEKSDANRPEHRECDK